MNKEYKISVIIPVYQAESYIDRCVRSLFEQTMDDIQFVFVDDSTPDKSIEIISRLLLEYADRNDDVVIVKHPQNMGQAAARNSGLSRATGEYIGWVDADDYVDRLMFQKLYETARVNDADIVCCDIIRDTKDGMIKESFPYDIELKEHLFSHIEGGIYSALWNKIVRRSLYLEHHISFVEGVNMWDDLSVVMPLRYYSQKTMIIHESLYVYNNKNASSITMSHQDLKHRMQMLKCAEYLITFFKGELIKNEYLKLLEFAFDNKKFLFYPPFYDLKKWRECLLESNKYLWNYSSIGSIRKLEYWVMSVLPFCVADWILRRRYGLS